jgi:cation transport regulator
VKQYESLDDLPDGVKNNLPLHAQEIYKSTFNHAYKEHKHEKDTESIAHRIAWSAVKQTYEQSGSGTWYKKAN